MEIIIGPILFSTFLFISIRHFIKVKRFNDNVPEIFKIKPEPCSEKILSKMQYHKSESNNAFDPHIFDPSFRSLSCNIFNDQNARNQRNYDNYNNYYNHH